MPQSQTILRAILVAILMSPDAPVVISPMTISSATRPPIEQQIWLIKRRLDWLRISLLGDIMVLPRLCPLGIIVTL
ncbi:MAG: hypothetical protein BWY82_01678 [Verrucomicrobia bacterium ADurb.Bin474]|nr:MAG: hypothetical protein BWY82_01678 [Verrucomicrobia bacterium ADurb.Bin474]